MSKIVERMALHSAAGRLGVDPDGLSISDDERDGIRAALRSVKPEDILGAQLKAFTRIIPAHYFPRSKFADDLRRALAASLNAAGA